MYTHNIDELNKKFKDFDISFESGELRAQHNPKNDHIIIYIDDSDFKTIEAMIGHELIHREQNKRSGEKYYEKTKKIVQEINAVYNDYIIHQTEELKELYYKKLDYFTKGTSQEKIAYAYQMTKSRDDKDYNFKTPTDIVNYLERLPGFKLDNQFKKYIGMYWLIKNII